MPPAARPSSFWPLLLAWLLIPALLVAAAWAWFEWSYAGRVYPGVQALGVDLGGMTIAQAQTVLDEAATVYASPTVTLRYGSDQVWPLTAADMGVAFDVGALVRQAYLIGRTGSLKDNLQAQGRAFWEGALLQPVLRAQPGALAAAIASRTAHLNRAAAEPRLSLDDLQVVISDPKPGQQVDVGATTAAVLSRLAAGEDGVVEVVVRPLSAAGADMAASRQTIQHMLSRTLVFADSRGEFEFALDPATLAGMLSWAADDNAPGGLRADIQKDKLQTIVEGWARQVARPPLDARFDFNPTIGKLIELSPSADGYALDVTATISATLAALASGQAQIALPVQIVRPAVASADAPNLGIKELVAQGTTTFAGSSADRVKNIEVGAAKFVGVVIPPAGVFSFNQYVGDVTAANGFEDALVIQGDTTAVGVGGGICQVSTTVFRAAWLGGFPIVERWNHGYVVRWYGAPGLDATVFTPKVDFKFKNTTGHYLLIKPIVDAKKGVITFQFYGTKPGWKVETADPSYDKRTPPPAPLYVEDPNLAPGRVVQFDWAVEGLEAVAKRRVIAADGAVLLNDTLKSRYLPWQAKYRFGPGFEPPAGAEVERAG